MTGVFTLVLRDEKKNSRSPTDLSVGGGGGGQLSAPQRDAAAMLGFDALDFAPEMRRHGREEEEEAGVGMTGGLPPAAAAPAAERSARDKDWSEMGRGERVALACLGWDEVREPFLLFSTARTALGGAGQTFAHPPCPPPHLAHVLD
eukprot:COSAG01_NODE_915_length_12761_cov_33.161507_2_plen_147_part_00